MFSREGVNKFVKVEEIEQYLKEGWEKGHLQKKQEKH
jgi:hypothetical protein